MSQPRITDFIEGDDSKTTQWRMRFSCARAAYDEGKLREAEQLLIRLQEPAQQLRDHRFAANLVLIGLGVVQLADCKQSESAKNFDRAIRALSNSTDPREKVLLGSALRFNAQLLSDRGDMRQAEVDLKKAVEVLESTGPYGELDLAYALSDFAGLYAILGRLSEAQLMVARSMRILGATLGTENKEFVRAATLFDVTTAKDSDLLDIAQDAGIKLQYQFGAEHPTMVRALRRYIQAIKERGETHRLDNVRETFAAYAKCDK